MRETRFTVPGISVEEQVKVSLSPLRELYGIWVVKIGRLRQLPVPTLLRVVEVPWMYMFWCLAYHLELSVKDALKSIFFSTIDDLLLRMYYMYNKSPKKCRELEDIIVEFKSCLEPSEMPSEGGSRPLRACGTRVCWKD